MSKHQVTEWSCQKNNPSCPLRAEFGAACQSSIRRGHCKRPASSIPGGYQKMSMLFVLKKQAAVNLESAAVPA